MLETDHISLKYFFSQPNLNARQARWLCFLSEFEFEINNIKGKENKIVDALSIHVHYMIASNGSNEKEDFE